MVTQAQLAQLVHKALLGLQDHQERQVLTEVQGFKVLQVRPAVKVIKEYWVHQVKVDRLVHLDRQASLELVVQLVELEALASQEDQGLKVSQQHSFHITCKHFACCALSSHCFSMCLSQTVVIATCYFQAADTLVFCGQLIACTECLINVNDGSNVMINDDIVVVKITLLFFIVSVYACLREAL